MNKPWELTDDELAAIPRIALGQPFPAILRLTEKAARRKLLEYLWKTYHVGKSGGLYMTRAEVADLRAGWRNDETEDYHCGSMGFLPK